jgi:hypothetical protein
MVTSCWIFIGFNLSTASFILRSSKILQFQSPFSIQQKEDQNLLSAKLRMKTMVLGITSNESNSCWVIKDCLPLAALLCLHLLLGFVADALHNEQSQYIEEILARWEMIWAMREFSIWVDAILIDLAYLLLFSSEENQEAILCGVCCWKTHSTIATQKHPLVPKQVLRSWKLIQRTAAIDRGEHDVGFRLPKVSYVLAVKVRHSPGLEKPGRNVSGQQLHIGARVSNTIRSTILWYGNYSISIHRLC